MPWTELFGVVRSADGNVSKGNRGFEVWVYGRVLAAIFVLMFLGVGATFGQEKHLSIYAAQTFYQVAVIDRPAGEYVGLLDILEPLGKIESHAERTKWRLRFTPANTTVEAEFEAGKQSGKVRGAQFDLTGEFLLRGDRGYVPVASLANLLPRLLDRTVEVHAAGRRLFLSNTGLKYKAEVQHNPTRLVITFPAPVAPTITASGNRVRLLFNREPVVSSGADNANFNDAPLTSAAFSETNGSAAIEVLGTGSLLATSSDGGKVISISGATSAAVPAPTPPTEAAAATAKPETPLPPPATPATSAAPARSPSGHRPNVVVIDAAHGGDERGAQLTDKLNEKDVTIALARRIQRELENRGFSVILVRTGDATLNFDQRATAANTSRAGMYLGIHAATLGTGVRVYTALVAPAPAANRRTFLPWESAQGPFVQDSTVLASAMAEECNRRKIPVRSVAAPIRPLNNIAGAAIAIEIAPEGDTVESINDAKYQQNVAVAVAAAIAASRGKLESQ